MKIMKVHFNNSQDYSLAYCHQTIEEVAWLPFQKYNKSKVYLTDEITNKQIENLERDNLSNAI